MIFKPIESEWAMFIYEQQSGLYPPAMHEELEVFKRLAQHSQSLGMFDKDILIGWMLCQDDKRCDLYIYDSAIIPEYQGRGFFWEMRGQFLDEARWLGLSIRSHARRCSYRVASDVDFLRKHGYELVFDTYLPNHYEKEYEDASLHGEHAHELIVEPIGRRRSFWG